MFTVKPKAGTLLSVERERHSVLGGSSLRHRLQPLGQARLGGKCPFFARASFPPGVVTFKWNVPGMRRHDRYVMFQFHLTLCHRPPKGPSRTQFSMGSRFGMGKEIRYGGRKTLRKLVFQRKKQQENGTDSKTLRPWQNTTDSSAVAFLVRKGHPTNCCVGIRMGSEWTLRTHTPLVKGVEVHPLIQGWTSQTTCHLSFTPLIKGLKLQPLN